MKKHLLLITIFLLNLSCKKEVTVPQSFATYSEAQRFVNNSDFNIEETANTEGKSRDNWISSAEYKANDENNGFLSIGMRGKQYVFDEVPYIVWEKFTNAEDMGEYYHENIKGKYTLTLKGENETDTQCNGITKKGNRCKRTATDNGYCFQHSD